MKIGTFTCWLFGHKFITPGYRIDDNIPKDLYKPLVKIKIQIDYCVRCGINK